MILNNRINRVKNKGSGMIEVLVTLVITAIGLLGLAGIQMTGLKSSQLSFNRSQAIVLAYDITDRMRANPIAITAGSYDQAANSSAITSCDTTSGCSSSNMATHDTYKWHQMLVDNLPSGDGLVCLDSTPNNTDTPASPGCDGLGEVYAIKIWWDDDRDGDISNDQPLIISFEP